MGRLRRAAAIALRQYYLLRGSPARMAALYTWILVDIVLWGFLSRYLNTVAPPGTDFVPLLLGAVLLWDFFTRVMHSVTTGFLEDVWSQNFLNLFASPLSVHEYTGGLVAFSVATSLVGLFAMVALAGAAFGLRFFALGLVLVPFLLVLFLFGVALGILGCALVMRFGPAAEWLVWPIPAVVTPFAAVFYPVSTLPPWMQWVSCLLPPSYVFEGIRAIAAGGGPSDGGLPGAFFLCGLYIFLAARLFARVHRGAVRSGLLARYKAESAA